MAHDLSIVQGPGALTGGTHSRNRKITNWATCQVCPAQTKQACTAICPEMERYLGANGRTITHNSPTQKQAWQTVEEMTGEQGEHSCRSLSSIRRDNPKVSVTETPESILIRPEAEQESETRVLKLICAFCEKQAKGDARKRSILESAIVLYHLERYSTPRVCEILEERYSGFGGYTEHVRKTGAKAGGTVKTANSAYKVRRIVQRFEQYVRGRLSPSLGK
jgi:hypothetical protein